MKYFALSKDRVHAFFFSKSYLHFLRNVLFRWKFEKKKRSFSNSLKFSPFDDMPVTRIRRLIKVKKSSILYFLLYYKVCFIVVAVALCYLNNNKIFFKKKQKRKHSFNFILLFFPQMKIFTVFSR